jgi:hypothetical protein
MNHPTKLLAPSRSLLGLQVLVSLTLAWGPR